MDIIESYKESDTARIKNIQKRIDDSNELIESGTLSEQEMKEEIEFRDKNIKSLNMTKEHLDALNNGKSIEEAGKIYEKDDNKAMIIKPHLM